MKIRPLYAYILVKEKEEAIDTPIIMLSKEKSNLVEVIEVGPEVSEEISIGSILTMPTYYKKTNVENDEFIIHESDVLAILENFNGN